MKNITPIPTLSQEQVEAQVKYVDELNEKSSTTDGHWIYTNEAGIVWQPSAVDRMGRSPQPPSPATPPLSIGELVEWGKTYDFDNLPKKGVVVIKINVADPLRAQMLQRAIAKQVLDPRVEKLKENQICVLFMQHDDDISVLTEEDMNKAGWEKKEKQRIITLS